MLAEVVWSLVEQLRHLEKVWLTHQERMWGAPKPCTAHKFSLLYSDGAPEANLLGRQCPPTLPNSEGGSRCNKHYSHINKDLEGGREGGAGATSIAAIINKFPGEGGHSIAL